MREIRIKILITIALVGTAIGLEGCGSNDQKINGNSSITNKDDLAKDAVNKETKEIDGKKVEEYTMKDGSKIQLEEE